MVVNTSPVKGLPSILATIAVVVVAASVLSMGTKGRGTYDMTGAPLDDEKACSMPSFEPVQSNSLRLFCALEKSEYFGDAKGKK